MRTLTWGILMTFTIPGLMKRHEQIFKHPVKYLNKHEMGIVDRLWLLMSFVILWLLFLCLKKPKQVMRVIAQQLLVGLAFNQLWWLIPYICKFLCFICLYLYFFIFVWCGVLLIPHCTGIVCSVNIVHLPTILTSYLPTYIPTYLPTSLLTYLLTCLPPFLHSLPAYIPTYTLLTSLHPYLPTYRPTSLHP